jgi:citrate synthase
MTRDVLNAVTVTDAMIQRTMIVPVSRVARTAGILAGHCGQPQDNKIMRSTEVGIDTALTSWHLSVSTH